MTLDKSHRAVYYGVIDETDTHTHTQEKEMNTMLSQDSYELNSELFELLQSLSQEVEE